MSEYLKDELLEKLSLNQRSEANVIYEDGKRKIYKGGSYKEKTGEYRE